VLRGWVQRNEDEETNDQEKLQDIREKRAQVQAKLDLLPSHYHYPPEQRICHNAQQDNEHQLLYLLQEQQQNDTAKTARGELEGQGQSSSIHHSTHTHTHTSACTTPARH